MKNYYKWPMGDFKGQNVYEFPFDEDKSKYLYAAIRDMKIDLQKMNKGTFVLPWSKHRGKKISETSSWLQNEWKKGWNERLYHSQRAFALFYESKEESSEVTKKYTPKDVMDKYQIIDALKDAVGYEYAKRSIDNMIWKFQKETDTTVRIVGSKAIAGRSGRLSVFLKEDVNKFIDWVKGSRGSEDYLFFE